MNNLFSPAKTCAGNLKEVDGSPFSILSYFVKVAKKQGWTNAEIISVRKEAMNGNYRHLIRTVEAHLVS